MSWSRSRSWNVKVELESTKQDLQQATVYSVNLHIFRCHSSLHVSWIIQINYTDEGLNFPSIASWPSSCSNLLISGAFGGFHCVQFKSMVRTGLLGQDILKRRSTYLSLYPGQASLPSFYLLDFKSAPAKRIEPFSILHICLYWPRWWGHFRNNWTLLS